MWKTKAIMQVIHAKLCFSSSTFIFLMICTDGCPNKDSEVNSAHSSMDK